MAQPSSVALPEPAQGAAAPAVAPQPLRVDDSGAAARDDARDGAVSDLSEAGETQATKKKKKKKAGKGKSTAKRGPTALPKNRGTGFEEYFADPPMTPAEAAEERDEVYASDKPFEERIQSCIQRFRGRRRLQERQTLYFNEYLFLGGIDTSAKAFAGLDERDLKGLTPAERRDATAADAVYAGSTADERFYNGDRHNWSVDFTGVVAGFLSTSLVHITGGDLGDMGAAVDVVENFLRYTLHHDVCPEYAADIERALQLCADAREQWPVLEQLRDSLPGPFNLAAADLFAPASPGDWSRPSYPHPEGFDAKTVFYSACALLDEVEALRSASQGGPRVAQEYDCTLEVVEVEPPSADVAERFKLLKLGDGEHRVDPIGKAFFRTADIEDGWEHPSVPVPVAGAGLWLYFEDSILATMKPGMKMALSIAELDMGIRFVKSFANLVPTYYTFLPQELMKHYKMPRPNERPAPSVHDPQAEDKQHASEAHGA